MINILLLSVLGLVALTVIVIDVFFGWPEEPGPRRLTCPKTRTQATVDLEVRHDARGKRQLAIRSCSHRAAGQQCTEECLRVLQS